MTNRNHTFSSNICNITSPKKFTTLFAAPYLQEGDKRMRLQSVDGKQRYKYKAQIQIQRQSRDTNTKTKHKYKYKDTKCEINFVMNEHFKCSVAAVSVSVKHFDGDIKCSNALLHQVTSKADDADNCDDDDDDYGADDDDDEDDADDSDDDDDDYVEPSPRVRGHMSTCHKYKYK